MAICTMPKGGASAKGKVNPAPYGQAPSCDPSSNGFTLTESYVLGQGGERLTTSSWAGGTGTWENTNVYAEGKLIATYDSTPSSASGGQPTVALHFNLNDPLDTRRMQTNSAGQPELDCQSLPFGDQLYCFPDPGAPGDDPSEDATGSLTGIHFTGKERDSESGNDYFGARYYASSMGRFLSPDWNDDPVPVPYADLTNPQTLNLYSYVQNNPLRTVDPDGHSNKGCTTSSSTDSNGTIHVVVNCPQIAPDASGTLYRLAGTAAIGGEEFGPADWAVVGGLLAAASCAQTHCGSAIANFFSNMGNKPTPPVVGPAQSTPGDPNQNGKPKLVSNPKHHPNSNSPEPPNARELYDKAIQDGQGRWWAKDADGTIHRFSAESNGETHWNGSTAGSNPIRMDNIPSEIRSALQ